MCDSSSISNVCMFVLFAQTITLLFFSGCCFVICPSREEADKAVTACHNKKTLPGVSLFIYSNQCGRTLYFIYLI